MKNTFLAVAAITFSTLAPAAQVITNGGFTTALTGWTISNQTGGDGTFSAQTGTTSPVNGDTVPAPPGGTTAAMSDGAGPGSHVLYQDFTISSTVGSAILSFDVFVGNRGSAFFTPTSLDFGIAAFNEQARVDLLKGSAGAFSLNSGDIISNFYQTKVGDPLVSGYKTVSIDITGLLNSNLNQSLRLRFAEVDNFSPLEFGVDNVSLVTTPAPEPSTYGLMLLGAGMALGLCRFRSTR